MFAGGIQACGGTETLLVTTHLHGRTGHEMSSCLPQPGIRAKPNEGRLVSSRETNSAPFHCGASRVCLTRASRHGRATLEDPPRQLSESALERLMVSCPSIVWPLICLSRVVSRRERHLTMGRECLARRSLEISTWSGFWVARLSHAIQQLDPCVTYLPYLDWLSLPANEPIR